MIFFKGLFDYIHWKEKYCKFNTKSIINDLRDLNESWSPFWLKSDLKCPEKQRFCIFSFLYGLLTMNDTNFIFNKSYVDTHLFEFDPKCIDWEHYIMNTHIPGLVKYSMKR